MFSGANHNPPAHPALTQCCLKKLLLRLDSRQEIGFALKKMDCMLHSMRTCSICHSASKDCASLLPCSPDLKMESKKLWRCPKGETQVFRRDPNASNSFFCGVGDRESSVEAADHQKLVLGVLAGTVVALCVGVMMWLVRSHPARVKKSALKLDWPECQVDFRCYSLFCAGSLSPSCAWSVE